ncbi:MAG: 2,3-diphosphoglycerate-dependent phosphoglycerate mutase [Chlorobi bacterium]|nr:2,3-diphosphoglycerate-dependent phosphoglycerate mutase [Chlorobiota bacterium]MCI0716511.1 2,3-diphosphoglycerate-dependent phosphoglycerate mutase [Chlorobiota bacterium]
MPKLVLIRHGESEWNKENRFTGWIDIPLSAKGEEEARLAGEKIKGLHFDKAFTSVLQRAIKTFEIAAQTAGFNHLVVEKDEALNERMYGDLQGLNKDECRQKFGAEKVHIWRRSYDTPPPNGESLKNTAERVLPYYHKKIEHLLKEGKDLLVVAHGNSLRALIMYLEKLTGEQIVKVEIPTGIPIFYELDEKLNIVSKKEL